MKEGRGKIINLHDHDATRDGYIYIGRKADSRHHFGNPFTYLTRPMLGQVIVSTKQESIDSCRIWLEGKGFYTLDQDRRQWILENVHELHGQNAGCCCGCQEDHCHGKVLLELAETSWLRRVRK